MDKYELARITGKVIKNLRKQRRITQDSLALYINTSRTIISKWEAGERIPSVKQYCQLASHFNVSLDYLVGIEQTNLYSSLPNDYILMKQPLDTSRTLDISGFNHRGKEIINTIYSLIKNDPEMLN